MCVIYTMDSKDRMSAQVNIQILRQNPSMGLIGPSLI